MMRKWKVLGRHSWVVGAKITESVNTIGLSYSPRRFTATIRGYRNWKLYEGRSSEEALQLIIRAVRAIRDQIDKYGEDAEAFIAVNKYSNADRLPEMVNLFENPICERLDKYLEEIL